MGGLLYIILRSFMRHYILKGNEILSDIDTSEEAVMALPTGYYVIAQVIM